MSTGFWAGRRVFVTGHTGFKGSWLCLWLASMGARVHGYALEPPTQPSLFEQAAVADVIESQIDDVRNFASVLAAVEHASPDVVFHMAAQSLVLRSYEDPLDTYSTNVLGTAHVLEALRRSGSNCAIVNVTTDKVYENDGRQQGYRENDPLGGRDPYSSSKSCAELVAHAYRRSFFGDEGGHAVKLASARAGNVIGGGDWTPGQLVPDVVAALQSGERVVLRHPDAIRPWQHVLDCLGGYVLLAERLFSGDDLSDAWNFGPPLTDARTVADVVDVIARGYGSEAGWAQDDARYAHEEPELRLDARKAADELGWRTRLSFDEAIEWTAEWYQEHAAGTSARELCAAQIERYEKLVGADADAG
jgi:CDP-glucose 4,6-dehydratase